MGLPCSKTPEIKSIYNLIYSNYSNMLQNSSSLRSIRLLLLVISINGFFIMPSVAQVIANKPILEKRVTVSFDKVSLKEALDKIAKAASVAIIYSNLYASSLVSAHISNKPLREILTELLAPFPLSYQVIDDKIVISRDASKNIPPANENKSKLPNQIRGKVTDSKGGPLPGANIFMKGKAAIATTDSNGAFVLNGVTVNSVIVVSFIGYQTKEITIGSVSNFLSISLDDNNSRLGEINVVSTGYQVLAKERATGSFVPVNNELLNRRVSPDVLSRLEGIVPGLLFNRNTNNGANGQTDISIRGTNTLFANNQPLIVVDNFPYDGDINNINPNDIENVTILKDAAAASIWGVRSGNGVIVMTTKKGKRDQILTTEFNANVTFGNKPDLHYNPLIKSTDQIDIEQNLFGKGYYDNNLTNGYTPVTPVVQILARQRAGTLSAADASAQINALRNMDVRDQLGQYFYQRSVNQQYALNLRGGNAKSDYVFSLGNDHDGSYYKGNQNGRITLNSLLNFYPVKNLTLTAGINYTKTSTTTNNPVYNGQLTVGGGSLYPYAQLVDANGNALAIAKDYALSYTNSFANTKYLDWSYRPLDELNNADNTSKSVDNRLNLGAQYDFFKHFSASLKYQYEQARVEADKYFSLDTYFARNLINKYTQTASGVLSYPIPVGGILQQDNAGLNSQRGRAQLNYSNNWNQKHEVYVIAGAEISESVNESNSNTAYGYQKETGSSFQNINYAASYPIAPSGSGQVPSSLGFSQTTDHYLSYFSNAAYTYDGKYTLSASSRIDKSNLFGVNTNQKSVPLYSTGLAWNVSKENFYHLRWLPYLKLRATYGYTGNINKSAAAVTTIKQYSGGVYGSVQYAQIANPGNPELRWEKVRMINFALDYATKNDIISGSIEYYLKKGIDLFGNSPLAPSTGYTTFFGNTADTKGKGIDLVVNSHNVNGTVFKWATNFQLSYAADIVTQYDVTLTSSNYITSSNASSIFPLTGKSLYGLYSYSWAGLSHATGEPQGYLNGQISTDYANILSKTSIAEMVYHGSSRPTTFGSFRNTFSYRDLSLSINVIYKFNYYFRRVSVTGAGLGGNSDYYKAWKKPGDELTTNVPVLESPPFNTNRDVFYQNSAVLIDQGDHIRLQDITLSYDLDRGKWKQLPFAHLQIYSYINNVGILWRANKDNLDPDLSTTLSGIMPLPRTIAFGLKAKF